MSRASGKFACELARGPAAQAVGNDEDPLSGVGEAMVFVMAANSASVRGTIHGKRQGHFGQAQVSDRAKLAYPKLLAQRGNQGWPQGLHSHTAFAAAAPIFWPTIEGAKGRPQEGTFRGRKGLYRCKECHTILWTNSKQSDTLHGCGF